jgi:N,N-dimethylformamidase
VGFSAQADTLKAAPGYRRTLASFSERYQWIFDGVSDEPEIGDWGLYVGGAAGYEIDRYDEALGSPPDSVVLMSSAGLHSDEYVIAIEDLESTIAHPTGSRDPRVRSDVVYRSIEGGGEVFSVGSCSWSGSLSRDDFDNDIAHITGNVLRRFLDVVAR